jgi:hypothetical protein
LSVTSNFGANPCFLRSLRISRNAARLSRRRCTSMSRTSPSWSTARQRYYRFAGTGMLTYGPALVAASVKVLEESATPDVQCLLAPGSFAPGP